MWRQDDLFRALDQVSRRPPATAGRRPRPRRPARASGPVEPARRTADARDRPVQRLDDAVCRRLDRHSRRPPLRRRRAARHDRGRAGEVDDDRWRRLRPTDPARPRCRARSLGHLVAAGDHLVRRDVVEGDQGRTPAPQRSVDPRRHAGVVGGDRHGHQRDDRRSLGGVGVVPARREHAGDHRARHRRRARVRGNRSRRDVRPDAARLLQGPGQVGGHVPHDRRGALHDAW